MQRSDVEGMAAVLKGHRIESQGMTRTSPDTCTCGFKSYSPESEDRSNEGRAKVHTAHLAEALAAAGYGSKAETLRNMGDLLRTRADEMEGK
jgi:hypothetical protein